MEKIDPGMNTINIGPTLYDSAATSNNGVPDIKTIHHTYVSILCMHLNVLKVVVYLFLMKRCVTYSVTMYKSEHIN